MSKETRFLVGRILMGIGLLMAGTALALDMYEVPDHRSPASQGMLVGVLIGTLGFSNAKFHLFRG